MNACFIAVPRGHLEATVIGTSMRYDFELSREVAELSLGFMGRGIDIFVMMIPNSRDESTRSHFNPEGAILVYANPKPTPYQGPQ